MYDILGLTVGILLGLCFPLYIPANMTLYMGVGLLAALDSAIGGVRAQIKHEFRLSIFLSGTIGNAVIAVFLTWLGERIGIPIYLAAVVVFGTRMFENFGEIRRELLTSGRKRDKIKQDMVDPGDADTP